MRYKVGDYIIALDDYDKSGIYLVTNKQIIKRTYKIRSIFYQTEKIIDCSQEKDYRKLEKKKIRVDDIDFLRANLVKVCCRCSCGIRNCPVYIPCSRFGVSNLNEQNINSLRNMIYNKSPYKEILEKSINGEIRVRELSKIEFYKEY